MKSFLLICFSCICLNTWAEGQTYKVGVTDAPPFTYLDENKAWKGINIWLLEKIADEQGFEYEFITIPKDSFIDENIDLYIQPIIIDKHNLNLLHYTPTYFTTDSAILVNNVTGFQALWNFIKSILSINFLKLVIAIFMLLLIVGLIVWLFERRDNSEQFESGWKGIGSGLWWSAVTLSTVGYGDISPRSLGGRIVGTIWMFSGILVVAAFTASMASLLTINQINTTTTGISDFKQKKVGVLENSPSQTYLERNFFKEIILYSNFDEGIKALKDNQIEAYIDDEAFLKYFVQHDSITDYSLLKHEFNPQYYSFGVNPKRKELYLTISKNLMEIISGVEWQLLLEEYNISYH